MNSNRPRGTPMLICLNLLEQSPSVSRFRKDSDSKAVWHYRTETVSWIYERDDLCPPCRKPSLGLRTPHRWNEYILLRLVHTLTMLYNLRMYSNLDINQLWSRGVNNINWFLKVEYVKTYIPTDRNAQSFIHKVTYSTNNSINFHW